MGSTTVTLEDFANRFQLWQDNKNSRFSPISIHLKDQIRQLLKSYSTSQVAAALNISSSVLYKVRKSQGLVNNNKQISLLFTHQIQLI